MTRPGRLGAALFASTPFLFAQEDPASPTVLPPVVVTATRAPQSADTLPVAVTVFSADDFRSSPSFTVDDTLRGDPAFSLFRRTGSLTANPTAQGVSLRGLGPSGASRSLVLLDGVPLNDPFGGWVAWTKVPKLALSSAEIVHGGGSGAWGNAALGGTVQLLTTPPPVSRFSAEAFVGDFTTRGAELSATHVSAAQPRNSVTLDAAAYATDGVYLLRKPGPVDRRADLAYERAQATWRTALAGSLDLAVTARAYAEDRGNGTPLQRNATDERFLSASLGGSADADFSWNALAYVQDQSFSSFFSAVDATRTTETPANDQYDVPATAVGGAFTAAWGGPADHARTTVGVDARHVEGETRERFNFFAGPFDRRAGGQQAFLGAFARHERLVLPSLRLSAGARVDRWKNTDGFRRETGPAPLDQRFADRDDIEFSPDVGVVWQAAPALRARGSVYQAFRVPTLNEYYRPFRVGPVTTNANADLAPETLTGYETGLDLGRPDGPVTASLTAFYNDLRDAVSNVTIAPNTRERRNIDRVHVQGLEAALRARPHAALALETAYLFTDARVTSPGSDAPASLDGNRLAQVPRHTFTTTATWDAPAAIRVNARLRWFSAQYEDDENELRLAPAATVDLGVSRRFARRWEVFVAVENLFDVEVETGRPSDTLTTVAPPRWSRLGVRYEW